MANRSQEVETALRRSKIYRLLSVGFSCPSPGGASEILDSLRELSDLTSQESHVGPVPPVTQDLICSHDRLFGYSSPFSAHETRYSCRDPFREAQELADISGFYRAFGLAAEGEASEIGDHIAVELEFLGLAAYREGQALSEGLLENAGICREAQARFLADHLGRWAPAFFSKLVLAQAGVYSWLARTAVAFLDQEKEFLEVSFEPFQLPNLVDGDDEERGCGEIVECKM